MDLPMQTSITDGKDAIDKAAVIEDVTKAKEYAINAVNAIQTKAEQPEEPTEETVAKTAAKNELDSLKNSMNEKDFDPADWEALIRAITDGIAAIDKAVTTDGIAAAKTDAVSAVNAIRERAEKTADLPSEVQQEAEILSQKKDKDAKHSTFCLLQAKQKKAKKKSITISWKRVGGATKYVIYGNQCGKKMKKLKTVSGTSFTMKKLQPGKMYKFIVAAYGGGKALATSKTIYIASAGGRIGNPTAVAVNKTVVRLKAGKTVKLKASIKKEKPVKKRRKICYESSNPAVAKVSKAGKIKAVANGQCYVYVYAQNGLFKRVKVVVK